MNPIDLLPIKEPLTDPSPPSEVDFYNNVVRHLIKDIIKIELNGIPIDLSKVEELEETITKVLSELSEKLSKNPLVQEFLHKMAKDKQKEVKSKTYEDFLTPFNGKNKIHLSKVINYFLKRINKEIFMQDEWTKTDLKKLCQVSETSFLRNLLNNELTVSDTTDVILPAMQELAQIKADIYNKNKKQNKEKEFQEILDKGFNPGSSMQKEAFFKFFGIESESLTDKGQDQWNRKELERLNSQLSLSLESKEDS